MTMPAQQSEADRHALWSPCCCPAEAAGPSGSARNMGSQGAPAG